MWMTYSSLRVGEEQDLDKKATKVRWKIGYKIFNLLIWKYVRAKYSTW